MRRFLWIVNSTLLLFLVTPAIAQTDFFSVPIQGFLDVVSDMNNGDCRPVAYPEGEDTLEQLRKDKASFAMRGRFCKAFESSEKMAHLLEVEGLVQRIESVEFLRLAGDYSQSILLALETTYEGYYNVNSYNYQLLRLSILRSLTQAAEMFGPGLDPTWARLALGLKVTNEFPGNSTALQFQGFLDEFPFSEFREEVLRMRSDVIGYYIEHELEVARYYYGVDKPFAALSRVESLYQHPVLTESPKFAEVLYWAVVFQLDTADQISGSGFDWDRSKDTLGTIKRITAKIDRELFPAPPENRQKDWFRLGRDDDYDPQARAQDLRYNAGRTAELISELYPNSEWIERAKILL